MDRYQLIAQNIQTVLIGRGKTAKKLARMIYREYGICSYICDSSVPLLPSLSEKIAYVKIPDMRFADLVCEELLRLAAFDPMAIYVAIPCTESAMALLDNIGGTLQTTYVLSSPNEPFKKIPIFNSPI